MTGRRSGFRARNRPSSARQSILLIEEMLFDNLIIVVSLKAADVGMSQVTKKRTILPLPHFPSERHITQRGIQVLKSFNRANKSRNYVSYVKYKDFLMIYIIK